MIQTIEILQEKINNALKNENHVIKENDFANKNPQSKDCSFKKKKKTLYPKYNYRQGNQILNQEINNIIINKNMKEEENKYLI